MFHKHKIQTTANSLAIRKAKKEIEKQTSPVSSWKTVWSQTATVRSPLKWGAIKRGKLTIRMDVMWQMIDEQGCNYCLLFRAGLF